MLRNTTNCDVNVSYLRVLKTNNHLTEKTKWGQENSSKKSNERPGIEQEKKSWQPPTFEWTTHAKI